MSSRFPDRRRKRRPHGVVDSNQAYTLPDLIPPNTSVASIAPTKGGLSALYSRSISIRARPHIVNRWSVSADRLPYLGTAKWPPSYRPAPSRISSPVDFGQSSPPLAGRPKSAQSRRAAYGARSRKYARRFMKSVEAPAPFQHNLHFTYTIIHTNCSRYCLRRCGIFV